MKLFFVSLFLLSSIILSPLHSGAERKKPMKAIDRIGAAERKGEISADEAAKLKAWTVLDKSRLPAQFADEAGALPSKDSTLVIREIKRDWDKLSTKTRDELAPYLQRTKGGMMGRELYKAADGSGRPPAMKTVLGGTTLPHSYLTEHFNIEWGNSNLDLTNTSPANGVPDIVEKWGVYLETSWVEIVSTMGYSPPLGSSDYYVDVYIGGTNGNAFPSIDPTMYGYTDVYTDTGNPFMVFNSFYNGWHIPNSDPDGRVPGAMKVTAAHEFFHTVHFTIDYWEDAWWMEASSTWMEDAVFGAVNDYYQYITPGTEWPLYPNVSLLLYNGSHEYGDVIFAKYISEHQGGTASIKTLWNYCVARQGSSSVQAMQNFFAGRSTTLGAAFGDFAAKNLAKDYVEGDVYGDMAIRSSHDSYPVPLKSSPDLPGKNPDFLGANYIKFTPSSGTDLTIAFDGDERFNGRAITWGAGVVLVTGGNYIQHSIPLDTTSQGGSLTITNYTAYSAIYLIPAVLSETRVTPSEGAQTPYGSYPDGVPFAYEACVDCTAPSLPLMEFPDNDAPFAGFWEENAGGCFIATAAFGAYDNSRVMLLRQFRDRWLMTNAPGRWFVGEYYRHSPALADLLKKYEWLKPPVRLLLMPLIAFAWLSLDILRLAFFAVAVLAATTVAIKRRSSPGRTAA